MEKKYLLAHFVKQFGTSVCFKDVWYTLLLGKFLFPGFPIAETWAWIPEILQ